MLLLLPILNHPKTPSMIPPMSLNHDAIISSNNDGFADNASSDPSSTTIEIACLWQ